MIRVYSLCKGPQWNPLGSCPPIDVELRSPYRKHVCQRWRHFIRKYSKRFRVCKIPLIWVPGKQENVFAWYSKRRNLTNLKHFVIPVIPTYAPQRETVIPLSRHHLIFTKIFLAHTLVLADGILFRTLHFHAYPVKWKTDCTLQSRDVVWVEKSQRRRQVD